MARSKHRRHLINMYILSVVIVCISVAVVLVGILITLDMRDEIIQMGKDLCVLTTDTQDDWGDIGGTRNRDLKHQFQIFLPRDGNNTYYHDIKYGEKPVSTMYGSYTWEEERTGDVINVTKGTDYSNYTGELFKYTDEVEFYQIGLPNNTRMNDTYTTYNYETFSVLYSHRMEEDWMRATRALSAMINYTSIQLRDQLVLHQLKSDFYESVYKNEELFNLKRLNVFRKYTEIEESTYHEFWIDTAFGFKDLNNSVYWGGICEERTPHEYYFIREYFYIPYDALDDFKEVFCKDWTNSANKVDQLMKVGYDTSKEARFYKQWASSSGTLGILNKRSMTMVDSFIKGYPEMEVYYDDIFKNTEDIKEQYQNVQFDGVEAEQQRFIELFKDGTDMRSSLFNATNMKTLYELGKTVGKTDQGYYETEKLKPLEKEMQIYSDEELYAIYRYLDNLVEFTFIKNTTENNTGDKLSMAWVLSDVLKNEIQNFRVQFSSKLLAAIGSQFTKFDTCEETAKRLFPSTSTSNVCRNSTNWLNTTSGLEFWMKLHLGRDSKYETADIKTSTYERYFNDDDSEWTHFVRSLLDYIGVVGLEQVCRYNDDPICTTQELAINQLLSGYVTSQEIPLLSSNYTPTDSYVDFFKLPNKTTTPELNHLGKFQGFEIDQISEINYSSIIYGLRDSKLFNPFYILSILNNKCSDNRRYCQQDFQYWLTFMYRNYGLPEILTTMTARDIFNGTTSPTLLEIQRKNPKYGGDPTIRTDYNVLPYQGLRNTNLTWEVFSGANNPDKSRNILRYNTTEEFITVNKTFYHQDYKEKNSKVIHYQKNPWRQEVFTAFSTDGSQFVPNLNDNDDLMMYTPVMASVKRMDYSTVDSIYGLKGYVYKTPTSLFKNEKKQKIRLQTRSNLNPYHNYKFDNMFNISAVYGMSYFATQPLYSMDSGSDTQYESEIYDTNEERLTDETSFNDHIIIEPYSGLIIRSDTSYQTNFFYDSWAPEGYKQHLLPYLLYQKRADIDGVKARDLFEDIEYKDERMKITLVICIIIGGVLFAAGGSLFMITLSRSIQRLEALKQIQEDEEKRMELIRKRQKSQKKQLKKREKEVIAINNSLKD